MPDNRPSYHERLLHWIWKTRHFNGDGLATTCGKEVQIHHTGSPNKSDGPDFTAAQITIGNLQWHGDVEIHWKLSDWRAHNHGQDPRYNNVILHVVFDETERSIRRADQTRVPTLWLGQYLSKPLESFLEEYLNHPQLPCARHLSFISEEAFLKQLDKAHKEYFEQKVDDLLAFYDADLPPSRAWLKLLEVAFFDGLGIPHNREPMRELAHLLFDQLNTSASADELRQTALEIAGLNRPNERASSPHFQWNHRGCRPANHPEHRIQQGALGLWHIGQLPFEQWMRKDPEALWNEIVQPIDTKPSLGKERASILFGTVFLPALYTLGNLFYSEQLKNRSWDYWRAHRVSLPKSLLKVLHKTDLDPACYNKKLGTIHLLRRYCKAGQCQKCFVFKNAISS